MFVVATAGHVDHGKSTLVKRLTGMEPDRWEEEKHRGLTIDLGFVWTTLEGEDVAFVDVPGHERFIANMLAGVGPATAVMFVVAADEGWMQQSSDHRDALDAFGIEAGIIAVTRADLAQPQRRKETIAQITQQVAGTSLEAWPIVEVSAKTGEGIGQLSTALARMLRATQRVEPQARVRMWIDRAFSIKGAGTVVTGTLSAGTIKPDDTLVLHTKNGSREVTVRSIQSEDTAIEQAQPIMRVALNLRGVAADEIHRGASLLTPDAWHSSTTIDVRRATGGALNDAPQELVVHLGTAGVGAKIRPFGAEHARLILEHPLPVKIDDALVLRGSGAQQILAGVRAIDVAPPELERRGGGRKRSRELEQLPDINYEIARRGAVTPALLQRLGFKVGNTPPQGSVAFAGYWIRAQQVMAWKDALLTAYKEHMLREPLSPGLPVGAGVEKLKLVDPRLLPLAAAAAKLRVEGGYISGEAPADLGPAEEGIRQLETHLRQAPFQAPEASDLQRWGLGKKELAAGERAGRVVRIAEGVVLLPDAISRAVSALNEIEQPFSASEARKAWGTTRRVAIPLLELLDARGKTRKVAGTARVVL